MVRSLRDPCAEGACAGGCTGLRLSSGDPARARDALTQVGPAHPVGRDTRRSGVTRWFLLLLGLAMGVLGLRALIGPVSDGSGPPLDEITAEDRAKLERVLEAADRQEDGG